jgi:hypothetical protein
MAPGKVPLMLEVWAGDAGCADILEDMFVGGELAPGAIGPAHLALLSSKGLPGWQARQVVQGFRNNVNGVRRDGCRSAYKSYNPAAEFMRLVCGGKVARWLMYESGSG